MKGRFYMSLSTPFIKDVPDENVKFSVIIPAHNEEKYIGECLESIAKSAQPYKDQVEVIVVLNRCTDKTKEIAQSYNCVTLGEILITIDADTRMTEHLLSEVEKHLASNQYIGGGVNGNFERMSLGIVVSSMMLIVPLLFKYGVISVGIF